MISMSIYRFDSISQQTYSQLLEAIDRQQYSIQLPALIPAEQILILYKKAISESRRGYLYQPCSIRMLSSFFNQTVSFEICPEAREYIKAASTVEFEVDAIVREAKRERTQSDMVKAVHSYFVRNYRYAYNHINDTRYGSALSVFLYRESVCEGFALAYATVMHRIGVPCGIVLGKSSLDGQACDHAWNIVQLGNSFYHVDVTWDICTKEGSDQSGFDYLLLDDQLAQADHWWNDRSLPRCSDCTQDFYAKSGSLCRTKEDCRKAILQQLRRKKQTIYFRCTANNKAAIVNSTVIPDILYSACEEAGISIPSFQYYMNPSIGTVRYKLQT